MRKAIEMTRARRRRVPKELEDLYWALPVEGRQQCMRDARWHTECARRQREREAQLAAGKWCKVSFSISPEDFRVLKTLADANDRNECGGFKPGNVAHEVLVWVMPALERLAESGKDCGSGVGLALHHRYGEPWLPGSGLGLVKPDGAV